MTSIDFETAYKIAAEAGRTKGRSFRSATLINHAVSLGIAFKPVPLGRRQTLAKFLRENPQGRFYVRKTGHAFAVIDGTVSDNTGRRCIVQHAWRFEGLAA